MDASVLLKFIIFEQVHKLSIKTMVLTSLKIAMYMPTIPLVKL